MHLVIRHIYEYIPLSYTNLVIRYDCISGRIIDVV